MLALRRRIFERYAAGLAPWAKRTGARLPTIPPGCESSYHMFHVILPEPAARDRLIAALRARDILAVFHYVPLHRSEMGRRFAPPGATFPVTDRASDCLVRLPFYNSLSEEDQDRVIEAVSQASL